MSEAICVEVVSLMEKLTEGMSDKEMDDVFHEVIGELQIYREGFEVSDE